MRLVTLAVVSERPRRVTKFVRHASCVDPALAKSVLRASGGSVERMPVVGPVDSIEVERIKAELSRLVQRSNNP